MGFLSHWPPFFGYAFGYHIRDSIVDVFNFFIHVPLYAFTVNQYGLLGSLLIARAPSSARNVFCSIIPLSKKKKKIKINRPHKGAARPRVHVKHILRAARNLKPRDYWVLIINRPRITTLKPLIAVTNTFTRVPGERRR